MSVQELDEVGYPVPACRFDSGWNSGPRLSLFQWQGLRNFPFNRYKMNAKASSSDFQNIVSTAKPKKIPSRTNELYNVKSYCQPSLNAVKTRSGVE